MCFVCVKIPPGGGKNLELFCFSCVHASMRAVWVCVCAYVCECASIYMYVRVCMRLCVHACVSVYVVNHGCPLWRWTCSTCSGVSPDWCTLAAGHAPGACTAVLRVPFSPPRPLQCTAGLALGLVVTVTCVFCFSLSSLAMRR